jgi:hypothetical protein
MEERVSRCETMQLEYENRNSQQMIELAQSLEKAYQLTNGLKEELSKEL